MFTQKGSPCSPEGQNKKRDPHVHLRDKTKRDPHVHLKERTENGSPSSPEGQSKKGIPMFTKHKMDPHVHLRDRANRDPHVHTKGSPCSEHTKGTPLLPPQIHREKQKPAQPWYCLHPKMRRMMSGSGTSPQQPQCQGTVPLPWWAPELPLLAALSPSSSSQQ